MTTIFYNGLRPHYVQRNLRFKPKTPQPYLRPPRSPFLLLFLLLAALLCTRHAGIISTISGWTNDDSSSPFAYGPVRVDSVIQFDGPDSPHVDVHSEVRQPVNATVLADHESSSKREQHYGLQSRVEAGNAEEPEADVGAPDGTSVKRKDGASGGDAAADSVSRDTKQQDVSKAQEEEEVDLKKWLNFSQDTAINFMHFHKTGGVSFKTALHKFYNNKVKSNGQPVVVRDACYAREGVKRDGQPSFMLWRCDWEPLREMKEEERNRHDFVFGHQFREKGVDELLNRRDLRTFTVIRHPFDRKVSFFYHFFVREVGRKEEDISFEEIRNFLLYDELKIEADLGRDLGPNYMAGRLLSDGREGYVGNKTHSYYGVDADNRGPVVERALELIRGYVFVGLQSQSQASQCMLRKVMEEFNAVNGVNNEGIEEVEQGEMRLNSGSYSLSAKVIWSRFSAEDRALFDRKERVDLTIYQEGERLFRKHVEIFRCADRLKQDK